MAAAEYGRGGVWPRRSISREFSLADHTLPVRPEPAIQKVAQSPLNGTTQTLEIEETTHGQWLKF